MPCLLRELVSGKKTGLWKIPSSSCRKSHVALSCLKNLKYFQKFHPVGSNCTQYKFKIKSTIHSKGTKEFENLGKIESK